MKLSDLGERKIIQKLSQEIDIGDDAAWLPLDENFLILTTDMLHEKTHLLPQMSLRQFGKLSVTVNLSDIAAMGSRPKTFLLSYASPDMEMEKFQEIITGVKEQCEKFKVKFAGGDTNEIPGGITLVGSMLGVMKEKPVLRSNAQVGDYIGVTGTLGAGFFTESLLQERDLPPEYQEYVEKTLEPQPRVKEGLLLRKYAHSMIDISDSLAVSLHSLAQQSKVGAKINLEKLPLPKLNLNLLPHALYGGGDYELLFTFPKENLLLLKEKLDFSVIGKIIKEQKIRGINKGKKVEIENRGYQHFSG